MFKKIWDKWKKIAEIIGNFQATLIFSLLFYILVTPFGLIMKIFSDPLKTKSKASWLKVVDSTSDLKKLTKQ